MDREFTAEEQSVLERRRHLTDDQPPGPAVGEAASHAFDDLVERGFIAEAAEIAKRADDISRKCFITEVLDGASPSVEDFFRYPSGMSGQVVRYLQRHDHDRPRIQKLISTVLGSASEEPDLLAELADGFEGFAFDLFLEGDRKDVRELYLMNVALRERVLELAGDEAKPHMDLASALALLDLTDIPEDAASVSGRSARIQQLRERYLELGGEPLPSVDYDDEVDFSDVLIELAVEPEENGAGGTPSSTAEWEQRRVLLRRRLQEMPRTLEIPEDDPGRRRELAGTLRDLSEAERELGQLDVALEHVEQAAVVLRELIAIHGSTPGMLGELSVSLWAAGELHMSLGAPDRACECSRESVDAWREMLEIGGWDGDNLPGPMVLSRRLTRLAKIEQELGLHDDAVAHLEESVEVRRRILRLLGEVPEASRDLAVALQELGLAEEERDREGQALVAHAESLSLFERILDRTGPTPQALADLSSGLYRVAYCQLEHGDRERALERFSQRAENLRLRLELHGEEAEVIERLIDCLEWVWALERALGNAERATVALAERRVLRQRLSEVRATPAGLRGWCFSWARLLARLFMVETAGLRPG